MFCRSFSDRREDLDTTKIVLCNTFDHSWVLKLWTEYLKCLVVWTVMNEEET